MCNACSSATSDSLSAFGKSSGRRLPARGAEAFSSQPSKCLICTNTNN